MDQTCWRISCALLLCGLTVGCLVNAAQSHGDPAAKATDSARSASEPSTPPAEDSIAAAAQTEVPDAWPGYPDVPYVPLAEKVGWIEIPRLEQKLEELSSKGEIPADVGNEKAKDAPGKPATGDWLIVRFSAEPKTMNPIVETSAVQTYIGAYVNEALVRRDLETLEWEPHIAREWVVEDSVKLAADYPGHERRVALSGQPPGKGMEIEFPKPPATPREGEKPPSLTLETFDGEGQRLGGVWVGLFPIEKLPGAPVTGYHHWSDEEGKLVVEGIVPGRYEVRVGAEIYGKAERGEGGSLTVRAEVSVGPLAERLASEGKEALELKDGEWSDVQHGTVYTYFLRDDVTWSDGMPFTSRDVEFAYAVINNEFVDGDSLRVYYSDLVECAALDPHTVRMKYRQQYFLAFEFTMGLSVYAPPWHVFEAAFRSQGKQLTLDKLTEGEERARKQVSARGQTFGKYFNTDDAYNRKPIGTGPYTLENWVVSDRIELRRNPNYWNKERQPYLDRLIFKFIPDPMTALQALKSGELDFCYGLTAEQFFDDLAGPPEWFKDRYVKAAWYIPAFGYSGWNMLKPKFQDRRVRMALSLLFDKQEYLDTKLHGAGVVISGGQYYFGPAYDHTVKPLAYDPHTAADLLAEAGWVDTDNDGVLDKNGESFVFEMMIPAGNKAVEDRLAVYQNNLKRAGIVMNIRMYEWASFIDKVKDRVFDAVTLGWATSLEADPFQIWHSSDAGPGNRGSNHVSFSNPLTDELIEKLRVTLDEEERHRIHWSLHRILDREQPYMFLYTAKDFGAYHHRFRGVKWYRVRPGFDFTEWYVPKDLQERGRPAR
ncbi:MAG: ABC transporter substrate-binding protein [Planctomycetaceae bacterium]